MQGSFRILVIGVKIINTFMIPLISFNSPLMKMAKIHWKEFLKPIKRFLWRNRSSSSSPWQWCRWRRVTTSKQNGGFGIIDPELHAQSMCANFLVPLTTGQQSWAKMAFECLELAKLRSQRGIWKGIDLFDKLLIPSWSTLSFRLDWGTFEQM